MSNRSDRVACGYFAAEDLRRSLWDEGIDWCAAGEVSGFDDCSAERSATASHRSIHRSRETIPICTKFGTLADCLTLIARRQTRLLSSRPFFKSSLSRLTSIRSALTFVLSAALRCAALTRRSVYSRSNLENLPPKHSVNSSPCSLSPTLPPQTSPSPHRLRSHRQN